MPPLVTVLVALLSTNYSVKKRKKPSESLSSHDSRCPAQTLHLGHHWKESPVGWLGTQHIDSLLPECNLHTNSVQIRTSSAAQPLSPLMMLLILPCSMSAFNSSTYLLYVPSSLNTPPSLSLSPCTLAALRSMTTVSLLTALYFHIASWSLTHSFSLLLLMILPSLLTIVYSLTNLKPMTSPCL